MYDGIDKKKYIVIYKYDDWNEVKKLFEDNLSISFENKYYQKHEITIDYEKIDIYLIPDNDEIEEINYDDEFRKLDIYIDEIFLLYLEEINIAHYNFLERFEGKIVNINKNKNESNNFEKKILNLNSSKEIEKKEDLISIKKDEIYNQPINEIDISQKLHIVVTGEFSKGKTKLINKLISIFSSVKVNLPEDLGETTSKICKVHFSKECKEGYFKKLSGKISNISELKNNEKNFMEDIEIILPLKNDKGISFIDEFVFIDTPGLNGTKEEFSYNKIKNDIEKIHFKSYVYITFKQLRESDFKCFEKLSLLNNLDEAIVFDLLINLDNRNPEAKQSSFLDGNSKKDISDFKKKIIDTNNLFSMENEVTILDFNEIDKNKNDENKIIEFFNKLFIKTLIVKEFDLLKKKNRLNKNASLDKKNKILEILKIELEEKIQLLTDLNLNSEEKAKFIKSLADFFGRIFTVIFNNDHIKEAYKDKIINKKLDKNDIDIIIKILLKVSEKIELILTDKDIKSEINIEELGLKIDISHIYPDNEKLAKIKDLLSKNIAFRKSINEKNFFSSCIDILKSEKNYSKYSDFLRDFKKFITNKIENNPDKDFEIKFLFDEIEELKEIINIL